MPYDEALAGHLRELVARCTDVSERKMMGALCFMVGDRMAFGVMGSALMVRVGGGAPPDHADKSYERPMKIGARTMSGFVLVDVAGLPADEPVAAWVYRAIEFASTAAPRRRAV